MNKIGQMLRIIRKAWEWESMRMVEIENKVKGKYIYALLREILFLVGFFEWPPKYEMGKMK
jgi:hypothetical protein